MKCNRCTVDKPEIEFIKDNKFYKNCNKCREKNNILYHNKVNNIIPPRTDLFNKRKEALTRNNYICSTCKEEQSVSEFATSETSPSLASPIFGYTGTCKTCLKLTGKFSKLKTQYNLSQEDFNKILIEQKGRCKICNIEIETFTFKNNKANTLCVDHCHNTGKVRGFLCNNCNRALGLFKDNENILKNAYNYIVHFKSDELLENPEMDNQQPSLELNAL